jgi:ketosteroid isomerase-like protein
MRCSSILPKNCGASVRALGAVGLLTAVLVAAATGCSTVAAPALAKALTRPQRPQINLSRVKGTKMIVPTATADYPPRALVDGITQVDVWEPGAGWQLLYDGAFVRDRYFDVETDLSAQEPIEWEGLRRDYRQGKEQSALAWVLFELARVRVVESVTVHSVDTAEFPAAAHAVRDVLVQYWDAATGRWMAVVMESGETPTRHTVTANTAARLDIDFHSVRTDLVRVAVRWTNDAVKKRSFTVLGVREEYIEGGVRLTEVEVYGDREDGDELAHTVQERLPDPGAEAAVADASDAIMASVMAYVEAYATRDLDRLMATISPDYLSEGENHAALRKRMSSRFEEFSHFLFRLRDANIESRDGDTALVSARYWLQLNPILARSTEGILTFVLGKVDDGWVIREIRAEAP